MTDIDLMVAQYTALCAKRRERRYQEWIDEGDHIPFIWPDDFLNYLKKQSFEYKKERMKCIQQYLLD